MDSYVTQRALSMSIALPFELKQKLEAAAAEDGVSKGAFCRQAIIRELADRDLRADRRRSGERGSRAKQSDAA